jgi:hypothetical protein
LKGILWVDILLKATSRIAEVDCHYSGLVAHASEQTVGFWDFLDRSHGDIAFEELTEEQIGNLYVRITGKDSGRRLEPWRPTLQLASKTTGCTRVEGRAWQLYLATAGVNGPQCLIHLNHTLAEGVITGLLQGGDRLHIRFVPTLAGCSAEFVSVRVHADLLDPTRVRAYAGIATRG